MPIKGDTAKPDWIQSARSSSDGHKNVLSLIGYSHILENRREAKLGVKGIVTLLAWADVFVRIRSQRESPFMCHHLLIGALSWHHNSFAFHNLCLLWANDDTRLVALSLTGKDKVKILHIADSYAQDFNWATQQRFLQLTEWRPSGQWRYWAMQLPATKKETPCHWIKESFSKQSLSVLSCLFLVSVPLSFFTILFCLFLFLVFLMKFKIHKHV